MMEVRWKGQVLEPGALFRMKESANGKSDGRFFLFNSHTTDWAKHKKDQIIMYTGVLETEHTLYMFNRFRSVTVTFLCDTVVCHRTVGGIKNYPVELDQMPEFEKYVEKLNI